MISRQTHEKTRLPSGFTLIELLVVITIIAILMGLLFPTVNAVRKQARRVQAKNDVTQLVVAIRAYITEYGKYPFESSPSENAYENGNAALMRILLGEDVKNNPRRIIFLEPPISDGGKSYGVDQKSASLGDFYDSFSMRNKPPPSPQMYKIRIDHDYDGKVTTPEGEEIRRGVIAWSLGYDSSRPDKWIRSWQ